MPLTSLESTATTTLRAPAVAQCSLSLRDAIEINRFTAVARREETGARVEVEHGPPKLLDWTSRFRAAALGRDGPLKLVPNIDFFASVFLVPKSTQNIGVSKSETLEVGTTSKRHVACWRVSAVSFQIVSRKASRSIGRGRLKAGSGDTEQGSSSTSLCVSSLCQLLALLLPSFTHHALPLLAMKYWSMAVLRFAR